MSSPVEAVQLPLCPCMCSVWTLLTCSGGLLIQGWTALLLGPAFPGFPGKNISRGQGLSCVRVAVFFDCFFSPFDVMFYKLCVLKTNMVIALNKLIETYSTKQACVFCISQRAVGLICTTVT